MSLPLSASQRYAPREVKAASIADRTVDVLEQVPKVAPDFVSSYYTHPLHLKGRHFPSNGLDKALSPKHRITLQTLSVRGDTLRVQERLSHHSLAERDQCISLTFNAMLQLIWKTLIFVNIVTGRLPQYLQRLKCAPLIIVEGSCLLLS